MGSEDDTEDLEAREWRRNWRLSGWGNGGDSGDLWVGSGDDTEDLGAREWRRQ